MRSNAAWSSGGVVRNALTVGVASGSVDALVITPGAASSLPAKIDSSTAGSGVQISSSWTAFKSGGQALLTAQGNGSGHRHQAGQSEFLDVPEQQRWRCFGDYGSDFCKRFGWQCGANIQRSDWQSIDSDHSG